MEKKNKPAPLPFPPLRGTLSEGLRSAKCKKTQNICFYGGARRGHNQLPQKSNEEEDVPLFPSSKEKEEEEKG